MNTESNAVPEAYAGLHTSDSQSSPPASIAKTSPLYWSVRRELWENSSIYIAPLITAAVYLVGFVISLRWLPKTILANHPARSAADQDIALAMPYSHAAMLLIFIGAIVGIFYCLDALHGERRDRSILFWKSLPVSDLTTVLSKASIPLVVLPLLVFAISVAVQIMVRILSTLDLLIKGMSIAPQWSQLPLFQMDLVLLYSLMVFALWHAPIYGWLLLVSGWARRATFLWAIFPPLAVAALEYIAFRTTYVGALLRNRLIGFAPIAFDLRYGNGAPIDPHFIPLTQLAPGRFLSSPGLWIGLVFAAIFLAAAVRLRKYQGPI